MRRHMTPGGAVPFREAFRAFVRIGLMSFGGPAGQIAVMHRVLVEEKRWLSEERFLHALNFCMLLPGPEAQQLATYSGWLLHRTLGGLVAGIVFILPGFLSILALSVLYAGWHDLRAVEGIFFGLKPAVLAVVVEALLRIGRRALRTRGRLSLAAAAFLAIFFFEVPFPLIVLGAGFCGWIGSRRDAAPLAEPLGARPSWLRTLVVAVVGVAVWLAPVALLAAFRGGGSVFTQQAVFFSKAAVVTFGGAYAVLSYVAQQAVEVYGWLNPREMLDGLGMAESTPGPLIQVVQFVGFIGAYRSPEELDPMTAGLWASLLVTWVTFAPSFLWIFLGAPYVEALRGHRALSGALGAITAAVVGVILNLAVWFALHTLFADVTELRGLGARLLLPRWGTLDPRALFIAAGAMLLLFRFKLGMLQTLALSAAAGMICLAWL
ncbi:MAG: chromate efflux transporter [Planctomycetaceae bacterium]